MKTWILILLAFATSNSMSQANATANLTCPPASKNCKLNSVSNLCQYDPDDYDVYAWAAAAKDSKDFFFGWYQDCTHDGLTDVSTAVHETTHLMTSEKAAYPLIDGQELPFATCANLTQSMLKPKTIAPQFDKTDGFVQTYLLGDASSATDFCYLLDEMNAYSHDLNTNIKLKNHVSVSADSEDRRAGLLATMTFLKVYADSAQRSSTKSWIAMQGPLKPTIQTLWRQANAVLKDSCGIPNWGGRYFFDKLCSHSQTSAIFSLVQESPTACEPVMKCRPEAL